MLPREIHSIARCRFSLSPREAAGDKIMSQPKSKLSRRHLFVGAGTAGALAAAAGLMPGAVQKTAVPPELKEPPERGGGYQLTDHVKRYYKSTLV
jgi:hypothetical protein